MAMEMAKKGHEGEEWEKWQTAEHREWEKKKGGGGGENENY